MTAAATMIDGAMSWRPCRGSRSNLQVNAALPLRAMRHGLQAHHSVAGERRPPGHTQGWASKSPGAVRPVAPCGLGSREASLQSLHGRELAATEVSRRIWVEEVRWGCL
jgi:hypothetical protein